MFRLPFSRRNDGDSSVRRLRALRPLVERFEGRQLLSAMTLNQGQLTAATGTVHSDGFTFQKIEMSNMVQVANSSASSGPDLMRQHVGPDVSVASVNAYTVRFYEYN
jgi:hypothetical protein